MSNFLAIATVTAALVQVLQQEIERDVPGATVTVSRPDATGSGMPSKGVNLYLFQVTPNAAWRNADLPTRDSSRRTVQRPCAALDLHYLLTFYGAETRFEPQQVLGSVVRILHERPSLTRQAIRNAIQANSDVLGASNLAGEHEMVKFTPIALSLEELSKLWSVFFQIPYTLSIAYQGSVVFVEGEEVQRSALPVREPKVYVMPFRQPVIEEITSQRGPNTPMVMGDTLILRGRQLRGDRTQVRIAGHELGFQEITDTRITLTLGAPPLTQTQINALRPGVQAVQVVQQLDLGEPPAPHRGFESDIVPFVLHPQITPDQPANVLDTGNNTRSADLTVTVAPRVGKRQRVILLLNEFIVAPPEGTIPASYNFEADSRALFAITKDSLDDLELAGVPDAIRTALQVLLDQRSAEEREFFDAVRAVIGNAQAVQFRDLLWKCAGPDAGTSKLTFHISGVRATDYLVRIQVDGAVSLLEVDTDSLNATHNRFVKPKVTIP